MAGMQGPFPWIRKVVPKGFETGRAVPALRARLELADVHPVVLLDERVVDDLRSDLP